MDRSTSVTTRPGVLELFMTEDHVKIDRLLDASEAEDGTIQDARYAEFRGALLRHIAMEEKVLLPFARQKRHGQPLPVAERLRSEHGKLAKLLVQSPSRTLLDALRRALSSHNAIEEGPRGLYATCDALAGEEARELVMRLRDQPSVPLAPYYDGPRHRSS
jgi:hypothetical protein